MVFVPSDGRLTSQNVLSGALTGSEVMYIVSPGNEALGVSYQITTTTLAGFFSAFPFLNTTIITSGASYNALTTDTRILVDKTIGSSSSILLPPAASMLYPIGVFLKDAKGDANTNPITLTFSGGELCDGLSSIIINNPYGWVTVNPIPGQSAWYQSQ
jgi:hypothetical protein